MQLEEVVDANYALVLVALNISALHDDLSSYMYSTPFLILIIKLSVNKNINVIAVISNQ